MSEAKHTPGPWQADGPFVRDGTCSVADARPTHADVTGDEVLANARLIAAAPELLAACKALMDGLDDYWITTEKGGLTAANAQAAIAKAEGSDR